MPSQVFLVAGGLIVVCVVLLLVGRYARRFENLKSYDNPPELFRELCRAHELNWSTRRLLKRLAAEWELTSPALLFVEPERFNTARLPAEWREHAPQLEHLRKQLFETPRVAEVTYPGAQVFRTPFGAIGLVAIGHEQKRGMVAKFVEDSPGLAIEKLVNRFAFAKCGARDSPGTTLDLEIDSQFVGGGKSRLRRAMRMKADVIQAVGLAGGKHLFPSVGVHGRVAREREHIAFQRATEKELAAVDRDLFIADVDGADAKLRRA